MKNLTVTIIGGGVSGLTAASYLSHFAAVTILEQGKEYEDRNIENSNEVLVGLGGAGTLSGGKLCFPPASSGIWEKTSPLMPKFQTFYRNLSNNLDSILSVAPVFEDLNNSDITQKSYRTELVLKESMQIMIGDSIEQLRNGGVVIRSRCKVNMVLPFSDYYEITFENENGDSEKLISTYVIIATGRTSVPFLQNLFILDGNHQPDLGIRLSLDAPQSAFARLGADIKIKQRIKNYLVRTFCVCCGGDSIKTATRNFVHYDGHFTDSITSITNLGLLARSPNYSGIKAAEHYLESMQKYVDKKISLKDFMNYYSVFSNNSPYEELFEVLVYFAKELYRYGFISQNADEIPIMVPAVDNINPLISTDCYFESYLHNVFVIGDAAGVSRGFVQSMWAGYCASERIIEKAKCTEKRLQSLQTA